MSNVALTYWQAGLESTPGTAVAATRKVYAKGPVPSENRPKVYAQQSRQNFIANYDAMETHVTIKPWTMTEEGAPFTELPWWFAMAIKGGVSPTGSGPYVYTFNDAGSSDDLKTATMEVNDGVGSFEVPYSMVNQWKLTGKGGSGPTPVNFEATLIGQKLTPAITMTAAISDRDLRGQYMLFKNTQLFMDDSAGNIGTTEVAAALEEFTIMGDNKIVPRYTGSAAGGPYSTHRRDERYLEFTAIVLFNSAAYTEFQNKWQANSGRYIQLKNTGSGNNLFTLNLYTKLATFEFNEDGPTRRVALMGQSIYDPTLGYSFQAVVQNDLTTIP